MLPNIPKKAGGKDGATILGVHLEGPFISLDKKGAHPAECIKELNEVNKNDRIVNFHFTNKKPFAIRAQKRPLILTVHWRM